MKRILMFCFCFFLVVNIATSQNQFFPDNKNNSVGVASDSTAIANIHSYLYEYSEILPYKSAPVAFFMSLFLPGAGMLYCDNDWGLIFTLSSVGCYYLSAKSESESIPTLFWIGFGIHVASAFVSVKNANAYNDQIDKEIRELQRKYLRRSSAKLGLVPLRDGAGVSLSVRF